MGDYDSKYYFYHFLQVSSARRISLLEFLFVETLFLSFAIVLPGHSRRATLF